MVGCEFVVKQKERDWLITLLSSKFFGSCQNHHGHRKNEQNVFCIDCNVGFCRHCVEAHGLHRQLQICKYVYQDVIRLQDIQKHLDCSKIQTYKINGEKAIHLKPRPQSKDSKPSTKAKFGGSCEACMRYLQDLPNRFCSIACKVSVVSVKPKDHQIMEMIPYSIREFPEYFSLRENSDHKERQSNENESSPFVTDIYEDTASRTNPALKPRMRFCKRKGIPLRAPLF